MKIQPDVLLIIWDQCSAKWIELAEERSICDLPNIRRLRKMGTSFNKCYSPNPVCCPARATIATGMSTRQHGLLQNGFCLDESLPTFMRSLQQAGWHTAAAGKVHLHPHHKSVRPDYTGYGFDECSITEDPRFGHWLDWVRDEHPEQYDAAIMTLWTNQQPEWNHDSGDGRSFRERCQAMFKAHGIQGRFEDELPFPEEVSQTRWITDRALDVMRRQAADQPLLLHVGYVQPHGPFTPPPGYLKRVNADRIPEPLPAAWADDPHAPQIYRNNEPLDDDWKRLRALYFADLIHLDEQLGILLDEQERRGRLDETLILFTADHGELLLDHGLRSKGKWHYDACIRVPLIVAGPGVDRERTCNKFAQLEDICPTILEGCGQPESKLPVAPGDPRDFTGKFGPPSLMHGRSLLPLCRGEVPDDWRTSAYCESYNNLESPYPEHWSRSIVTARWRYTVYGNRSGDQLFDCETDPAEQRNLAGAEEHCETLHALQEELLHRVILQDMPGILRSCYAVGVH